MRLASYIKNIGDTKAATLFGVSRRTASSWRQGVRRPRPETAKQIVKKTNGDVSMEDIYGSVRA